MRDAGLCSAFKARVCVRAREEWSFGPGFCEHLWRSDHASTPPLSVALSRLQDAEGYDDAAAAQALARAAALAAADAASAPVHAANLSCEHCGAPHCGG